MIPYILKWKKFVFVSLLIFLFSGCAYFGIGGVKYEKSSEELMREGMIEFEDGDYSYAVEAF